MSQDNLIKMECMVCRKVNYHTTKNHRIKERLVRRKLCPSCHKHTEHKETK